MKFHKKNLFFLKLILDSIHFHCNYRLKNQLLQENTDLTKGEVKGYMIIISIISKAKTNLSKELLEEIKGSINKIEKIIDHQEQHSEYIDIPKNINNTIVNPMDFIHHFTNEINKLTKEYKSKIVVTHNNFTVGKLNALLWISDIIIQEAKISNQISLKSLGLDNLTPERDMMYMYKE